MYDFDIIYVLKIKTISVITNSSLIIIKPFLIDQNDMC
jgi:hypothetical protein